MRLAALSFVCLFIAVSVPAPALAAEEGHYLGIRQMSLTFDGSDATATVYFDLDMFGDIYILAFGSRHLEPELQAVFVNFDDVTIREIGRDKAVIDLGNVSRKSENYYLFPERELGKTVGELTLIYPTGSPKHLTDVSVIPYLYYEAS
jgi:hypothetical protein